MDNYTISIAGRAVRFLGDGLRPCGETQVLSALPLAMQRGEAITVDLPVAPGFLDRIAHVQRIFVNWYGDLQAVDVRASEHSADRRGVAAAFSGGVDSFHTALTARPERLLLVHGFDFRLDQAQLRHRVSSHVASAAVALGAQLVEIETNLREEVSSGPTWGPRDHGFCLAAAAYLLAPETVLIPASYSPGALFPWGTHPDVDEHFGSDATSFIHHAAVPRSQKIKALASNPTALAHLRVCYLNPDEAYNCARCEKCVRTMISLAANDSLEACATFPDHLDLDLVRALDLRPHSRMVFAMQNYRLLAGRPEMAPLRSALCSAIVKARLYPAKRVVRRIPGVTRVRRIVRR